MKIQKATLQFLQELAANNDEITHGFYMIYCIENLYFERFGFVQIADK